MGPEHELTEVDVKPEILGAKNRVLVVEDSDLSFDNLWTMLGGWMVMRVTSADMAKKQLDIAAKTKTPFDLVVLDNYLRVGGKSEGKISNVDIGVDDSGLAVVDWMVKNGDKVGEPEVVVWGGKETVARWRYGGKTYQNVSLAEEMADTLRGKGKRMKKRGKYGTVFDRVTWINKSDLWQEQKFAWYGVLGRDRSVVKQKSRAETTKERMSWAQGVEVVSEWLNAPPECVVIADKIEQEGGFGVLVGGSVRDMLLSKLDIRQVKPNDVDMEVYNIDHERLAELLKKWKEEGVIEELTLKEKVSGGEHEYGIQAQAGSDYAYSGFRIKIDHQQIDISVARESGYDAEGKLVVRENPRANLEDTVWRRDVTINALVYDPIRGVVFDPLGGVADLKAGVLRAVDVDHFGDDPERLWRLIKAVRRFGFEVEEKTLGVATEMVKNGVFDGFSQATKRSCFIETMFYRCPDLVKGFGFLAESGMLDRLLTGGARAIQEEDFSRLAEIKAIVTTEGSTISFRQVQALLGLELVRVGVGDETSGSENQLSARLNFFPGVKDVVEILAASVTGEKSAEEVVATVQRLDQAAVEVSGKVIMEKLGIGPGPAVGVIKKEVLEEVARGTSGEKAFEMVVEKRNTLKQENDSKVQEG